MSEDNDITSLYCPRPVHRRLTRLRNESERYHQGYPLYGVVNDALDALESER